MTARNTWSAACVLFLLLLPVLAFPQVRYVDEKGVAHWVSSFDQIPERYREQALEREYLDSKASGFAFFEPTSPPRKLGESPSGKWQLIQRDITDNNTKLGRRVLESHLWEAECVTIMENVAAQDPNVTRGEPFRRTKSGKGVAVIYKDYRNVGVRVWQCVEE